MPAYVERVSYVEYVENFQHAENFSTYKDVCQHTTTYTSVLLTYAKLTHNVFDVCQLGWANFSYVGIRWLKRQGVTAASHFDV